MPDDTNPPALVTLTRRLEGARPLDVISGAVQPVVDALLADPKRADALHGMWVGHSIHPMLTDVPIGVWTSATILDFVGGKKSRKASQRLIAIGVLAWVPTAVTGWSEWGPLPKREQRVGLVHAVSNASALVLYANSWRARRRGSHAKGVLLGLAGSAALQLGGYLGGHLVETRKVASAHPAYAEVPAQQPVTVS
jgi:uncharacterized membrane protein